MFLRVVIKQFDSKTVAFMWSAATSTAIETIYIQPDTCEMSAPPLARDDWPSKLRRSGPNSVSRTSYRIQLLVPPAWRSSVWFSGRMGCDTVFPLPAHRLHGTVLQQTDDVSLCNRTCQSPHVSHCSGGDWHHIRHWLVRDITCPVRVRKHIVYLAGKLLHVMDVHVVD